MMRPKGQRRVPLRGQKFPGCKVEQHWITEQSLPFLPTAGMASSILAREK